jgi:hypothetical protein
MRKKKRPTLAPADLTAAWSAVVSESKVEDLVALGKAGWKTSNELSEILGKPKPSLQQFFDKKIKSGEFETRMVKAISNGKVRNMRIYRPVVK